MHLKDLGNLDKLINIFNTQGNTDGIDFFNSLDKAAQAFTITSGKLTLNQLEAIKATAKWTDGVDGIRTTLQGLSEKELDAAIKTATLAVVEKEATSSTLGLGTAVKGLGTQFKIFATAHPILLAITSIIAALGVGYKVFDLLTVSVEEAKEGIYNIKTPYKAH